LKLMPSLMALLIIALPSGAFARGHSGSHHFSGHVYGFRTSSCKASSCFRKHPDGKYVHPLTSRKPR
jgi:hypothetical protein